MIICCVLLHLAICSTEQVEVKPSALKDKFLAAYPKAAAELRSHYAQLSGNATLVESQRKLEHHYEIAFWFNGDLKKTHILATTEVGGQPKGQTEVQCCNDRYGFLLKSRANDLTSYGVRYVGKNNAGTVDGQDVSAIVDSYATRFVKAPLGLDMPFDQMMKDSTFKLKDVTQTANGEVIVEFSLHPSEPRFPLVFGLGFADPVDSVEGTFCFDPAIGWALKSGEAVVILKEGKGRVSKSIEVSYGDEKPAYLTNVILKFKHNDKPEGKAVFTVSNLIQRDVPIDEFSLGFYGLGDLEP